MRFRSALFPVLLGVLTLATGLSMYFGFFDPIAPADLIGGNAFARPESLDKQSVDPNVIPHPEDDATTLDTRASREDGEADHETIPLVLRVVEAKTGAALPQAEIFIIDDDALGEWMDAQKHFNETFKLGPTRWGAHRGCVAAGKRLVTDAAGTVKHRALAFASTLYMLARSKDGRSRGFRHVDTDSLVDEGTQAPQGGGEQATCKAITIEVGASRDFAVQVVDRRGRPAPALDCALFLLSREQDAAYTDPSMSGDERNVYASPIAYYRSDARGEIRVEHVQALLDEIARENPEVEDGDRPASLLVVPKIPMLEPASLRIPLAYRSARVRKLILGPTARLELHFEHADGSKVLSAMDSYLDRESEGPLRHGRLALDLSVNLYAQRPFGSDGRIVFPFVGARTKLRHEYDFSKQSFGLEEEIPPLRRAGLVRRATRLPKTIAAFRAKIGNADASALPEAVHVDCVLDGRRELSTELELDPDNCIRFVQDLAHPQAQLSATIWEQARLATGATIDDTRVFAGRENVLPDVLLRKIQTIARGTCRDDRGAWIRGATVRVMSIRRRGGRENYRTIPNIGARTNARGRFELPIPTKSSQRLLLSARSAKHGERSLEYRADSAHDFVLPRLAHVSVRVSGAPIALDKLSVSYSPVDRGQRKRVKTRIREGRGLATFRDVPPGRIAVAAHAGGFFGSWTKEVSIEPGSKTTIDLPAPKCHEYQFRIQQDWDVRVRPTRKASSVYGSPPSIRFGAESLTLQSFEKRLELAFHRPGFESLSGTWHPGLHALDFRPLSAIRIEIDGLDKDTLSQLIVVIYGRVATMSTRKGVRRFGGKQYFSIASDGSVEVSLENPTARYGVFLMRKKSPHEAGIRILMIPASGRLARYPVTIDTTLREKIRSLLAGQLR